MKIVIASLLFALTLMLTACGGGSVISEAHAELPKTTVVAYGDSMTAGYIPVDGVLQLKQNYSYTEFLKNKSNVITTAVAGATAEHGLKIQSQWVREIKPDVVILMFGVNDAIQNRKVQDVISDVSAILNKHPTAKRIAMSPPVWSEETKQWQMQFRDELKLMSNQLGVIYVDHTTDSVTRCTEDRHPCKEWHDKVGKMLSEIL